MPCIIIKINAFERRTTFLANSSINNYKLNTNQWPLQQTGHRRCGWQTCGGCCDQIRAALASSSQPPLGACCWCLFNPATWTTINKLSNIQLQFSREKSREVRRTQLRPIDICGHLLDACDCCVPLQSTLINSRDTCCLGS